MAEAAKRVRVPDLIEKKRRGEKIVVLTAYDFPMAQILDRAAVDVRHGGARRSRGRGSWRTTIRGEMFGIHAKAGQTA